MSNGRLKAQYNRVRTSVALRGNDMWNNTIGVEQEMGANSAVEAAIYAPSHGGGDKKARQERAQQLISAAGYQPAVTDYKGLMSLAKAQGLSNEARGACKLCGGLGHLTKKCTNFLTGHAGNGDVHTDRMAGLAGPSGAGPAAGGLLPDPDDLNFSSDISSSSESGSDSGSSSDSDSGRERKKKKSKRSKKEKRSSSKKEKHSSKDKVKKHRKQKKEKKSKDKSSRRSRSRSPARD